jgi:hypothetical protein
MRIRVDLEQSEVALDAKILTDHRGIGLHSFPKSKEKESKLTGKKNNKFCGERFWTYLVT